MNYFVRKYKDDSNFRLFTQLLMIFVLSRIFLGLMVPVYNTIMGTDRSFSFLMNEWDAKRYQFMIDNGYTFPLDTDPQANWAFFPLYVIVCQVFKFVTGGLIDTYWLGMIVSNICIFIAAFYGVKIVRKMNIIPSDSGLLVAALIFAGPYAFYFSSTYTESMFFMFIVLCFYFAMNKKYMLAGLMSALASATRIVGCVLVFVIIIEMWLDCIKGESQNEESTSLKLYADRVKGFIKSLLHEPYKIFSIMICPLGTFLYMFFLRLFCGDIWAFKNVQIAWREDTFFPIIGVLWKACTGQIEPRYTYMGWICIAVLAVYVYMFIRKYYSMAVFGIIALLIPLTSHVMSTCRFIVGTFVIYVGLYDLLKKAKKPVRVGVLIAFAIWEIILVFMWYNSDCWLM